MVFDELCNVISLKKTYATVPFDMLCSQRKNIVNIKCNNTNTIVNIAV